MIYYFAAILYFIPFMFAAKRQHKNTASIFLTNLIFGWTGVGWVLSLIWAFSSNVREG